MLGNLISSLLRTRRNANALCAQGAELFSAGRVADCVSVFEQALACEPDCMAAHAGLGAALQKLGERERALPHLTRAADADPAARGLNLLVGQLLLRSGKATEASTRLARLAAAHPQDDDVVYHFAIALRQAGDEDSAAAQLRALIERQPGHAAALEGLAALQRDAGRVEEAIALYQRVAKLRPEVSSAASAVLFHEQYREHDRAELYRRHVEWGQRFAPAGPAAVSPRDRDPERPLTIGYVSADFNSSSAVQFIEPILHGHDRRAFRVVCYAASSRTDAVTLRLQHEAALWRDIDGRDDDAARALVKADGVDILVDLNGHTRGGRLGVFAPRAAPVQVTYLGYGATTGVAAMDYRITDERLDPPGASEEYYVERLVRSRETMWCFAPPAGAPAVSALPAASGGRLSFASLNNFSKVGSECLAAWARILEQFAGSRLVFVGVPAGNARQRVLQSLGIDASRLIFHPRLSFEHYLALHAEIDIALDSFPYTGGATTCNALWMGVPVLTLQGDAVLARSGSSILRAAGLKEWVAGSAEDYIAKACRLGADLRALAQLRAGLRDRLRSSALCDAAGFVQGLEAAYRDMWRTWCRTA
jgi:protein O-GlcNAc transferase